MASNDPLFTIRTACFLHQSNGPPITITTAYLLRSGSSIHLNAPESRPVRVVMLPISQRKPEHTCLSRAQMTRTFDNRKEYGGAISHRGIICASQPFVLSLSQCCILVPCSGVADDLSAGFERLSRELIRMVLGFAVTRDTVTFSDRSKPDAVHIFDLKAAFQDYALPLLALGRWACYSRDGECHHRNDIAKLFSCWSLGSFSMLIPLQHLAANFRLEFQTFFSNLNEAHQLVGLMTGCDNAKVKIQLSWQEGPRPDPIELASVEEWTEDRIKYEGQSLLQSAEGMLSNHMIARKEFENFATVFPCIVKCVFARPAVTYRVQKEQELATEYIEEDEERIKSIEDRVSSLFISCGADPAPSQSINS